MTWRGKPPVARFTLACPACGQAVDVPVHVIGIETRSLSLTDVHVATPIRHDCPDDPGTG